MRHRDAYSDARKRRGAAGDNLARGEHVSIGKLYDGHVERFTAQNLLPGSAARAKSRLHFLAGLFFVARQEFIERRPNAAGSDQSRFGLRERAARRRPKRELQPRPLEAGIS